MLTRDGLFPLLILLAVCALVFAPSAWNGFTYDDRYYVQAETPAGTNVMVAELHPVHEYFTKPYGFGVEKTRGFRPATVYGFAWTHHLFADRDGDPPWPHHVLNILLHLCATLLVYRILIRNAGPPAALLGAAVFGLHALRSDPVASVVGRGELLAFVFGAGALLLFARALAQDRGIYWRLAGTGILLASALFSKESAIGWAAFLPIFVMFVDHRQATIASLSRPPRVVASLVVLGLPLVAFFVLRGAMLAEHGAVFEVNYRANPIYEADLGIRVPTATIVFAYGLLKVLVPYPLICEYGIHVFEIARSWADPRFLGALLVLLAILVGGSLARRRHPMLFAAMAIFLGFGFITSNIWIPVETIFAERLYYTPALGLSFLVCWAASRCAPGSRAGKSLWLIVGIWLAANAGLSVQRCLTWRDDNTLFLTDVTAQPRSLFLNIQAARIHHERGNRAERDRYLEHAVQIAPESSIPLKELGQIGMKEGNFTEAIDYFERAIALSETNAVEDAFLHQNIGVILSHAGRETEAAERFRAAMATAPESEPARISRIWLLWQLHRAGDAPAMSRLLREAAAEVDKIADPEQRQNARANVDMFHGMFAYRDRDLQRAIQLLGSSFAQLDKAGRDPNRVPAIVAYILSLHQTGERIAARQVLDVYLQWPRLPAKRRAELERVRSQLRD